MSREKVLTTIVMPRRILKVPKNNVLIYDVCDERFCTNVDALLAHLKEKHGINTHVCDVCEKRFCTKVKRVLKKY